MNSRTELWPDLPYESWKETYATLHLWTQVVGKVRLKLSPFVNHWWETAFYVSTRGLRTSVIPYGSRAFEIEFDFIDHLLVIRTAESQRRVMALAPRSVADFYREFMELLASLGIDLKINIDPKEVPSPIPFDQDRQHDSYDREYANRFWRILLQSDRIFNRFRGGFIGKCSPVHFFWGSFDLAVSRFSGRRAPPRPGADLITRVGYSHETISCGFWPGSGNILEPAFYSYSAPEPPGFSDRAVSPPAAFYNPPTKGFILKYKDVQKSENPDQRVLDFCQSTYEAGADLGNWDRKELERQTIPWRQAA